MEQKNFVTLTDYFMIEKILTNKNSKNEKSLLWQKTTQSKKQCSLIGQITYETLKQELTFYPKNGKFQFTARDYIYFAKFKKLALFKSPLLYNGPFKIITNLPSSLLLEEERVEQRLLLSGTKRMIQFIYNPKQEKIVDDLYLMAELLDVSSSGLSFKSSIYNVIKFKIGDRLLLREFQKVPWGMAKMAQVRHVSKTTHKQSGEIFYKIGLLLS